MKGVKLCRAVVKVRNLTQKPDYLPNAASGCKAGDTKQKPLMHSSHVQKIVAAVQVGRCSDIAHICYRSVWGWEADRGKCEMRGGQYVKKA